MEPGESPVHKLEYRSAPVAAALSSRALHHADDQGVIYLLPPAPRRREIARLLATAAIALFPLVGLAIELRFVWRYALILSPAQWLSEIIILLLLAGLLALLPIGALVRGYRQGLILDLDQDHLRLTLFGRFTNQTHAWARGDIIDLQVIVPRLRLFAPRLTLHVRLKDRAQRIPLVYHDPRHDLPAVVALLRQTLGLPRPAEPA